MQFAPTRKFTPGLAGGRRRRHGTGSRCRCSSGPGSRQENILVVKRRIHTFSTFLKSIFFNTFYMKTPSAREHLLLDDDDAVYCSPESSSAKHYIPLGGTRQYQYELNNERYHKISGLNPSCGPCVGSHLSGPSRAFLLDELLWAAPPSSLSFLIA